MSEELSDFPACFKRPDVMPWDSDAPDPVEWPFGPRSGEPLTNFSSATLLRFREIVVKKNGAGVYFLPLVQAIDAVLFEREGL